MRLKLGGLADLDLPSLFFFKGDIVSSTQCFLLIAFGRAGSLLLREGFLCLW